MRKNLYPFFIVVVLLSSCTEENATNTHKKKRAPQLEEQHLEPPSMKVESELQKATNKPMVIPVEPNPDPSPPIPYPIEPYVVDPFFNFIGPPAPLPKTIYDSIVNFPAQLAAFGNSPADLLKYIDAKIRSGAEWEYLKEFDLEGKIYIRLLIDAAGKVREVTFLRFSDKELEILKSRLKNTLLTMPNWTAAQNESGTSVVSEYTFPVRIELD
ncbi:MAG: hypothetical protein RLZZ301_455 [Bacteroidota bacterium]|jgi:hypothetical protein